MVGKVVDDLGVEVMPAEVAGSGLSKPASNDLSRPNPDGLRNEVRNALALGPPLQKVPRTDSGEESFERRDGQTQTWLTRGPVVCVVDVTSPRRVRKWGLVGAFLAGLVVAEVLAKAT